MTGGRQEAAFYRSLNALVEPWVRAGFGSPLLIVVETVGRRSGRVLPVPLLAWPAGGALIVSTVRGQRSQWVKNLAARPNVRYWQCGRPRTATATVFQPEPAMQAQEYGLAAVLQRAATCSGLTFALLTPRTTAE